MRAAFIIALIVLVIIAVIVLVLSFSGREETPSSFLVEVVSSNGQCGSHPEGRIKVKARSEGPYVQLKVTQGASNPCFRHVIRDWGFDMGERIIRIDLELERTSKICIQCVGVIDSLIKVGPLPPGEWTIKIDGRSIRVTVGG